MRKYLNVPTVVDGVRFDSKKEARVIADLRLRERAGEITALRYLKSECRRTLHVAGVAIGTYTPDAIYLDVASGREVWLDVKSPATRKTAMYRWKRRHVAAEYGITITEA